MSTGGGEEERKDCLIRWSPVQSVEKILLSVVSMLAGERRECSENCRLFVEKLGIGIKGGVRAPGTLSSVAYHCVREQEMSTNIRKCQYRKSVVFAQFRLEKTARIRV